jgi:predicted CoA-binding protein
MDWRLNLIGDASGIAAILSRTRRIAVLGIKTKAHPDQPAFYVPKYLQTEGFEIIPVPVYYPNVSEILGKKVYRRLTDIPVPIDLLNVFRRSQDLHQHVDDILSKMPAVVWFQLGIRNDAIAETLARAGIRVVQDRCIMVEHRWWCASGICRPTPSVL